MPKDSIGTGDTALLKEITNRFDVAAAEWEDTHREGNKDMRCVAGDPWDPKERKSREDASRPCLALDEIGQYINQAVNNVRQNPRGIVAAPRGSGATEKTAWLHQGLIRGIEDDSKAKYIYADTYAEALQRGYAYMRVSRSWAGPKSWHHNLKIDPIPNPDIVYPDPFFKKRDGSDWRYCFVLDEFDETEFRDRWPNAEIKSFSSEQMALAPKWIKDKRIQVAEYWKVKRRPDELILLADQAQTSFLKSELNKIGAHVDKGFVSFPGDDHLPYFVPIKDRRPTESKEVCQYITNGLEILEYNEWPGQWIPIIPVYGKILYVDEGAGTKRKFISLVRMARDPYMLYCYYRTQQAEFASGIPKNPWVGVEGQFEGHEDAWDNAHRQPVGRLEYKIALPDGPAAGAQLPPPTRPQWDAQPLIAMDQAAESARRAIQAAMGMYDSSVGKRDPGVKSGIALKELDRQGQQGSYHFVDALDQAMEHAGKVIDELLPIDYDTAREVPVKLPDESRQVVTINDPEYKGEDGEQEELNTAVGEHDITISTGPSYPSQVEEIREFIKAMLTSGIPQAQLLLDMFIKLANLGPLGEEMADRVRPPQFEKEGKPSPQQLMAMLEKLQTDHQALNAYAQKMEAENQQLKAGLQKQAMGDATKLEIAEKGNQTKIIMELVKAALEEFKAEVQIALGPLMQQREEEPVDKS